MQLEEQRKKLAFELARTKNILEYYCETKDEVERQVKEVMLRLASVAFPQHTVSLVSKVNGLRDDIPIEEECKEPEFEILHKILGLSK